MIREEFKLIMQVVFSLSEHDLKTELQDSSDVPKRGSKKKDKHLFQIKCQSQDEIRAKYLAVWKGNSNYQTLVALKTTNSQEKKTSLLWEAFLS